MTTQVLIVLAVIVGMSILFVSEALPLAFTAFLVPVLLQASGLLDHTQAWAGFSNYIVIAQVSLFIIGAVFAKSSFLSRIRNWTRRAMQTENKLLMLVTVLLVMVLLSIAITATSAIAVTAPILMELCDMIGLDRKTAFKTINDSGQWASTLTLPIGASFSFFLLCNSYLELAGADVRFGLFDFFVIKGPTVLVILAWAVWENWRTLSCKTITSPVLIKKSEALQTSYTPRQDALAQIIFFLNLFLMILSTMMKNTLIQPYLISAFFAVVCVALHLISDREAFSSVSWSVIFLIAGTLPLSTAIKVSGTDVWIAELFQAYLPTMRSPFFLSAAFCIASCLLTQFASNTAVIAIFVPIGIGISAVYGMDPRLIVSAVFCGASMAFATPMSTTSAAYVYEKCGFSMKEFIRLGWRPCVLLLFSYIIWAPAALRLLYP